MFFEVFSVRFRNRCLRGKGGSARAGINKDVWFRGLFTWTSRSRVLAAEGNQDRVSRIHWIKTGLFGGSDILLSLVFGILCVRVAGGF